MARADIQVRDGRVDLGGGRQLAVRRYRPGGADSGPVLVFLHEGLVAITL